MSRRSTHGRPWFTEDTARACSDEWLEKPAIVRAAYYAAKAQAARLANGGVFVDAKNYGRAKCMRLFGCDRRTLDRMVVFEAARWNPDGSLALNGYDFSREQGWRQQAEKGSKGAKSRWSRVRDPSRYPTGVANGVATGVANADLGQPPIEGSEDPDLSTPISGSLRTTTTLAPTDGGGGGGPAARAVGPGEAARFQTWVASYCARLGKPHPAGAEWQAAFAVWCRLAMTADEERACRAWVPSGGERGTRWWPKPGAFLERWEPELERHRVAARPMKAAAPADYRCECGELVHKLDRKRHEREDCAVARAKRQETNGTGPSSASNGSPGVRTPGKNPKASHAS